MLKTLRKIADFLYVSKPKAKVAGWRFYKETDGTFRVERLYGSYWQSQCMLNMVGFPKDVLVSTDMVWEHLSAAGMPRDAIEKVVIKSQAFYSVEECLTAILYTKGYLERLTNERVYTYVA